jgi:hypothetical protein
MTAISKPSEPASGQASSEDVEYHSSGSMTYKGYRGHEYDFGMLVAKQNDRIMEAGRAKHTSEKDLNVWIDTINDLEDLLHGFWIDRDIHVKYMNKIDGLKSYPSKTKEERIKLGHLKLRALMKLQHDLQFQGIKRVSLSSR